MGKQKTLKKKLGFLKYRMIDCWPYIYHVKKAASLREIYRKMLVKLPPIAHNGIADIEIHMQCGKGQIDMGIWASWSLMRFLETGLLYIHSDGTITDADMQKWKRVIPDLVLIRYDDANKVAEGTLSQCPTLLEWRKNYWTGPQVIDVHLFGKSQNIILIDSDVLTFCNPDELINAKNDKDICLWCKDIRSSYLIEKEALSEILSCKVPEKFNCGVGLMPRMGIDEFVYLEEIILKLKELPFADHLHLWSGQTYLALLAANKCRTLSPLSSGYDISRGKTKKQCIMRHYVGIPSIRPRYFLEGIPRLLSQAGLKGS